MVVYSTPKIFGSHDVQESSRHNKTHKIYDHMGLVMECEGDPNLNPPHVIYTCAAHHPPHTYPTIHTHIIKTYPPCATTIARAPRDADSHESKT